MKRPMPLQAAALRQRIRRHKMRGTLHSGYLRFPRSENWQRRKVKAAINKCAKIICDSYLLDNIKAPLNNPGKSALLANVAFDIYFGDNKEDLGLGKFRRTAYATGSGQSTIGLDPRHKKIHCMFPELSDLRNSIKERVRKYYKDQNCQLYQNCDFNHVSCKLYFHKKVTRPHTDIQFDKGHQKPTANNSQKPMTPVVIVTFGDSKILEFQKHSSDGEAAFPEVIVPFVQKNGCLIILDPRDEYLDAKLEYWKHSSQLLKLNEDVSLSMMFRVVQATVDVYEDGRLVNPTVWGTGKKEKQLNDGWEWLQKNKTEYDQKCSDIHSEILDRFSKYF